MTERSSKRRKLNHSGNPPTAPETSPSDNYKPRSRASTAGKTKETRGARQGGRTEDTDLNDAAQRAELPNNDEDEDVIVVVRRSADQSTKLDDPPKISASIEDTSVRASGRKRKPPAKLKEVAAPDVRPARPRAKPGTTTQAKHRPKSSVAVEEQEEAVDMISPSQKAKAATGKENQAPAENQSDAEGLTELAMLRAQMALELHEELDLPSPPLEHLTPPQQQQQQQHHHQQLTIDHDISRPWTPEMLSEIQLTLLSQLTRSGAAPVDLEEEYQKVQEIVNQAVETGESNSMILIGSRGSGKTMLVNHVLQAQRQRYPEDFHIVRLNGFIHTDDKLALRDIWRQLGRDMEPDVSDDTIHSYADTLAMLLALLSDAEELGQSTRAGHMAKSVIFVLDEFDLFATHPRQTLLYNLFDIAQSRKAPIAVLGLTTRVDIVEALEKRVKSRFSHRYVHFGLAKSLSTFKQICASFLTLPVEHTVSQMWAEVMEGLQAHERYHQHISKIYYRSKSVADFLATLLLPLASLQIQSAMAVKEIIEHVAGTLSTAILGPDSKLDLLPSMSSLQLALLICAARQGAIYNTDNVTFNLVYEEYKSLAGKAKLQATASGAMAAGGRVLGKDVAKIAWHELVDVGFVLEDGRGFGKVDIGLEEIAGSGVDLGQWSRWCKEI